MRKRKKVISKKYDRGTLIIILHEHIEEMASV